MYTKGEKAPTNKNKRDITLGAKAELLRRNKIRFFVTQQKSFRYMQFVGKQN